LTGCQYLICAIRMRCSRRFLTAGKKAFFENGAAAFEKTRKDGQDQQSKKIAALEQKL
jgi:hypothetical protein